MPDEVVDDAAEAGLPIESPAEPTLEILRHSAAHLMASAVVELFPGAKYDVGPPITDGFFYNFRLPQGRHFTEDDLATIEQRMRDKAAQRIPFTREVMPRAQAHQLFTGLEQPFKVDIIDRIPQDADSVGIYRTGDFVDLCRGPHVPDTGWLKAVKLLRVAGVYWRGDERNEQLQRVYGTAWFDDAQLQAYLDRVAEAERRDHRKLGRDLDLYSVSEDLGGGLVLWHPNGGLMRGIIEDHWRDTHRSGGYDLVFSPHIALRTLWETSGHVDFYADNMYAPMLIDERPFQLKPMNCPFHILIYRGHTRSYRDLPLRYAELGTVYRYERSGVLHGLLRVRGFTQDDAHLFCRPDQIEAEIGRVVDFSLEMFRTFGFVDVNIYVSTKPDKSVGSEQDWRRAEAALENQLRIRDLPYKVQPGEGAFYGPKIDVGLLDALGREWQCATIQFDFNEPERFQLEFVAEDGSRQRPVMVHRALLGSMERFFGVMVEHYAGDFPLWLCPVQCEVVVVQDNVPEVLQLADGIAGRLRAAGLRSAVNAKPGERLAARIRSAEVRRVPYVVVVGKNDVAAGGEVLKLRDTRLPADQAVTEVTLDELVGRLSAEAARRGPEATPPARPT